MRSLPERTRVTYFAGRVLLDDTWDDWIHHTAVKSEIVGTVYGLARQLDLGEIHLSGGLLVTPSADFAHNPDGVGFVWGSFESGRIRMVKRHGVSQFEGSADWVLEVVSPSTVDRDTRLLRTAYHVAGVREYWLIDSREDGVEFAILRWTDSGYVAAPVVDGWQESRIFGRCFRLVRTLDEFRHYEFSLESRVAV